MLEVTKWLYALQQFRNFKSALSLSCFFVEKFLKKGSGGKTFFKKFFPRELHFIHSCFAWRYLLGVTPVALLKELEKCWVLE